MGIVEETEGGSVGLFVASYLGGQLGLPETTA